MKITKYDLVKKLANKTRMMQSLSLEIVTSLFDIIMEELAKGNHVVLPTLGTLRPILHKAHVMGNLHGDGNIIVPPKLRIKLIQSIYLKKNMQDLYKLQTMESTSLFK